jgi:hypothetical protein
VKRSLLGNKNQVRVNFTIMKKVKDPITKIYSARRIHIIAIHVLLVYDNYLKWYVSGVFWCGGLYL